MHARFVLTALSLKHTHSHTRTHTHTTHPLFPCSLNPLVSAKRLTSQNENESDTCVPLQCKQFFLRRPLNLDHITMGAICIARDFCLFLLLLNTRQSAALPHNRGTFVLKECSFTHALALLRPSNCSLFTSCWLGLFTFLQTIC